MAAAIIRDVLPVPWSPQTAIFTAPSMVNSELSSVCQACLQHCCHFEGLQLAPSGVLEGQGERLLLVAVISARG